MAGNVALADSSFIYAIYDVSDSKHPLAWRILRKDQIRIVIPDLVLLGEVMYLLKERIGIHAVVKCLDGLLAAQTPLESIILEDLRRIREINTTYASARFDFVDCCLMALSERLNITQVYTFDRRDFSIFRPKHCSYLELLPELNAGS